MNMTSDFARLGITVDPSIEPTEARGLLVGFGLVPEVQDAPQAVFRNRDPYTPYQRLCAGMDGNLKTPSHVKFAAVDYAEVAGKLSSDGSLGQGNRGLIAGSRKSVVHWQRAESSAATATGPFVIQGALAPANRSDKVTQHIMLTGLHRAKSPQFLPRSIIGVASPPSAR
ncbi:MAG TPA: hypothetical protein VKQ29_14525 [Aliidongia sp.]|nr:hypothetical protein [Aliidongia sp.]